jgi:Holliday junction resolvase
MLRVSVLVVIDVDLWNKSTIYIRKNYIEGFYLFLNKIKKKMRLALFKRQIFTSTASYIKIKLKKPWWSSDKSLELRSLLPLWFQVQALRLLI